MAPQARNALERALALDPQLAEAHALMATTIPRHEWDWPRAEEHYLRALTLAPQVAEVHHEYAMAFLSPLGRFEEAFAEYRRARELDPFSPAFVGAHIWLLIHARRLDEAEQDCRRVIAESRDPHHIRSQLGIVLFGQGRLEEACAEFQAAGAGGPNPETTKVNIAILRAMLGQPASAQELLERFQARSATYLVPVNNIAFLHGALEGSKRGFPRWSRLA